MQHDMERLKIERIKEEGLKSNIARNQNFKAWEASSWSIELPLRLVQKKNKNIHIIYARDHN